MFQALKTWLYFPIAYYFRFFARIKLARWKPRIIVVTGSNGKTTLLHLIESQIGDKARYSHHANSSYGIPFDILGLERKTLMLYEWFELFLKAPFLAFLGIPKQKIYIVEADCDRPFEGKFLSTLLKPEVTIWLSSSRTHSMNFDYLVSAKFENVEEAIAHEYGHFIENTSNLVIVNSDSELIKEQLSQTCAKVVEISKKMLGKYDVSLRGSKFEINRDEYSFKYLLPEAVYSSIAAVSKLCEYLNLPYDNTFPKFRLPPGRSSVFKGIKGTTLVDSSYNSSFSSAKAIIDMFNKIKISKKWIVIGDMLEQGKEEEGEHKKLAQLIVGSDYDRVILLGPRIIKYGLPILEKHYRNRVVGFENPREVLNYIKDNIQGGETVLFKGARFLEGVIENLLANKQDARKLSRREKIWEIRREKWGL